MAEQLMEVLRQAGVERIYGVVGAHRRSRLVRSTARHRLHLRSHLRRLRLLRDQHRVRAHPESPTRARRQPRPNHPRRALRRPPRPPRGRPMTQPDHRHVPFPLDKIIGITTVRRARRSVPAWQAGRARFGNLCAVEGDRSTADWNEAQFTPMDDAVVADELRGRFVDGFLRQAGLSSRYRSEALVQTVIEQRQTPIGTRILRMTLPLGEGQPEYGWDGFTEGRRAHHRRDGRGRSANRAGRA